MAEDGQSEESSHTSSIRRLMTGRRGALVGLLAAVLALVTLVWSFDLIPIGSQSDGESPATAQARADAGVALEALGVGDREAVEESLAAHRADPAFAYFFTRDATPRALGDLLGTVAEPEGLGLKEDVDPKRYDVVLADLADTLSLATQNTGEFDLPATWAESFAAYTTRPGVLTEENVEDGRIAQDQANKQNLLLLLARGRWGTDFLMTMTKAFWDWEHNSIAVGSPWPGVPSSFMVKSRVVV
ncbi:hypothetical protein ncot_11765 [Nocardioides sp. JQ2195]|uniref:hypothetical protein n=1 Tax=Nocardioides sp. JQ2195 TaxID=2592334 RepID=UPI00143E939D|nr:hypothetical protein [Nocardioides sp. JQ2195]QIX27200.1 hypothetical protein ncot_11765 [Nocardioides sp. JQ2195]